ncbi:short-chain fatty acid transporter [Streptomonospora sp. PA3]|uniref:short-chain fatty acid transporter n=1 Tax=Streptomonospora sp. PA3 TaxID=2607326 RepID=UPI0012DBEB41|nr:TIGR00366 family protein [Streptomonospora sp. PA3]MUL40134.1 short-chain fatty acid transporter [Streptomonospora sp. PA3]
MRRIGNALAAFSTRWIPDAFVFAIALTVLVYLLALGLTDHGPLTLVDDWYAGFWGLLEFAMQMSLVLVTGYALASSPPAKRGIAALARLPRGPRSAYVLTAAGAAVLGMIHWGLGLIAGALLAVEVARSCRARGIKVHFPLLAAGGYVGLMVWHSGLSGSAPLLVNTEGHFLEGEIGVLPLSETLLQPFNLVFLAAMLIGAPLLIMSMHPRAEDAEEIAEERETAAAAHSGNGNGAGAGPLTGAQRRRERKKQLGRKNGSGGSSAGARSLAPAERLMHSRIPVLIVVAAGAVYLVPELVRSGIVGMDLNLLNFTFLMLGLALHGTLASYSAAAAEGARNASSVIVQFPFYAGIMGIMEHSGLLATIAEWFVSFSTPLTYPFWAMISACLVNLAVPSGGGQWAVQGPIVTQAASSLGLEPGVGVMAVAMGDQLTNGIQPFWALPLLALTRLRAGRVLGYSAAVMLFGIVAASLCITFLR